MVAEKRVRQCHIIGMERGTDPSRPLFLLFVLDDLAVPILLDAGVWTPIQWRMAEGADRPTRRYEYSNVTRKSLCLLLCEEK